MATSYEVHERVSLATDDDQDRYREATVMAAPSEGDDNEVSLWFDSMGMGFHVNLTPAQSRELGALLIKAAGKEGAS